jgi:homoserine kinase
MNRDNLRKVVVYDDINRNSSEGRKVLYEAYFHQIVVKVVQDCSIILALIELEDGTLTTERLENFKFIS